MTNEDMRRRVERCVDAVSVELYEGVTTGFAEAQAMLRPLSNGGDYPYLVPLSARAFMREHWLANGLPGHWHITGNPRLMGQTILTNAQENLELRLLKERRGAYPGGVPVAGASNARKRAWRQEPFGFVAESQRATSEQVRLLALWDTAEDGAAVKLRVVHPLVPGIYGSKVPIDLSYEIVPSGGIFASLEFVGAAQDDDLFAEIDRDENEGDVAAS